MPLSLSLLIHPLLLLSSFSPVHNFPPNSVASLLPLIHPPLSFSPHSSTSLLRLSHSSTRSTSQTHRLLLLSSFSPLSFLPHSIHLSPLSLIHKSPLSLSLLIHHSLTSLPHSSTPLINFLPTHSPLPSSPPHQSTPPLYLIHPPLSFLLHSSPLSSLPLFIHLSPSLLIHQLSPSLPHSSTSRPSLLDYPARLIISSQPTRLSPSLLIHPPAHTFLPNPLPLSFSLNSSSAHTSYPTQRLSPSLSFITSLLSLLIIHPRPPSLLIHSTSLLLLSLLFIPSFPYLSSSTSLLLSSPSLSPSLSFIDRLSFSSSFIHYLLLSSSSPLSLLCLIIHLSHLSSYHPPISSSSFLSTSRPSSPHSSTSLLLSHSSTSLLSLSFITSPSPPIHPPLSFFLIHPRSLFSFHLSPSLLIHPPPPSLLIHSTSLLLLIHPPLLSSHSSISLLPPSFTTPLFSPHSCHLSPSLLNSSTSLLLSSFIPPLFLLLIHATLSPFSPHSSPLIISSKPTRLSPSLLIHPPLSFSPIITRHTSSQTHRLSLLTYSLHLLSSFIPPPSSLLIIHPLYFPHYPPHSFLPFIPLSFSPHSSTSLLLSSFIHLSPSLLIHPPLSFSPHSSPAHTSPNAHPSSSFIHLLSSSSSTLSPHSIHLSPSLPSLHPLSSLLSSFTTR
ncbi:hypothetical protein C7M84_017402 [Penaeus vannamei]|uniref:Uncharacterized protein n=1 Tax=Penaeus vannamei TaxID=6689 RepID=A0A3R7PZN5_PENVA|nr:hypothetical protein C7M84_017402 [Penaeus vannamei]